MNRSSERSWGRHRQLASHLTEATLAEWLPVIRENFAKLERGVEGEPHLRHLQRWRELVDRRDVAAIQALFVGRDRAAGEMREVSPFGGLLSEEERLRALVAGARPDR